MQTVRQRESRVTKCDARKSSELRDWSAPCGPWGGRPFRAVWCAQSGDQPRVLCLYWRTPASIVGNTLGRVSALNPLVGRLVIALMACYGSEKVRGYGILEAMEPIRIGCSRVQPKVAIPEPLSCSTR